MDTRALKRTESPSLCEAAEKFYAERISEEEKSAHRGEFVAIDAIAGRCAFGRTSPDALRALPPPVGDALPYIRPVGFAFRLRTSPRS